MDMSQITQIGVMLLVTLLIKSLRDFYVGLQELMIVFGSANSVTYVLMASTVLQLSISRSVHSAHKIFKTSFPSRCFALNRSVGVALRVSKNAVEDSFTNLYRSSI